MPVLPATWYPGICADVPVPVETTSFSIVVSSAATARDTIRRRTGRARGCPATRSTRCGRTQTPPFAIAAYAAAICTGVTAMPWPIGTLPIDEPDQ